MKCVDYVEIAKLNMLKITFFSGFKRKGRRLLGLQKRRIKRVIKAD